MKCLVKSGWSNLSSWFPIMIELKKRCLFTTALIFAWEYDSTNFHKIQGKGKTGPLQAWRGPESSMNLSFSDFIKSHRMVVRFPALRTGRFYLQGIHLLFISVRGSVDPRDIVRWGGLCLWKILWHHRESNPPPSGLQRSALNTTPPRAPHGKQ